MSKVLILGPGGREHALGWKIGQNNVEIIYAPGNAGTQEEGRNVPIDAKNKDNFSKLLDLIHSEDIEMVLVGPEDLLANGLVDYLSSKGYTRVFGPTQSAARLESDKFFSYDLMKSTNIPQADSVKCFSIPEAIEAIKERTTEKGIVIKPRRLTAGKGVSVCDSKQQALEKILTHSRKYGSEVLISERLYGQEFSVFALSDGTTVLPLKISFQDHKSLLDGDQGPNTGGMGAYGPAPIASSELVRSIVKNMMNPVVQEMKRYGVVYKGFLYGGFIMTKEGPKVLEFNVRFGDPECQPAMMLIDNLYEPISLALEGRLDQADFRLNPGAACCVVLASKGYPEADRYKSKIGLPLFGIDEANDIKGVKVFHAGTHIRNNLVVINGGRVLGVTAYSPEGINTARKLAYEGVERIVKRNGDNILHYRRDIANKALN